MPRKNKSRRNYKKSQSGGRVLMPIQYFGGELNRYYPEGSQYLKPLPNAYGPTIAKSFGTSDKILTPYNLVSPNLASFGLGTKGENLSCGVQTGGRRRRVKSRSNKRRVKSRSNKRKKTKRRSFRKR